MSQDNPLFSSLEQPIEQAARQIFNLGFKTDGPDAQLTELFIDLLKFHSATPQFQDRELTYFDPPYWPDKLIKKQVCELFNILVQFRAFPENGVQQQQTAVQRFTQPSSSANKPQGQTAAKYLKHDFLIEASTASKQPHQGQSPICHGLPMGIDDQVVPQPDHVFHQSVNGHRESSPKNKSTRDSGFHSRASSFQWGPPFGQASTAVPDRDLLRDHNSITSMSEEIDESEQLQDFIRIAPTQYSHKVAHTRSIGGSRNVPKQAHSASSNSYPPKGYTKELARHPGSSPLEQVELDTAEISLLASLGPAVVDTSFADIHAHYTKTNPPCVMKLRAIAPHLNPGARHTVMLADSNGDKPLNGRIATVTSFSYAPKQIILVLRYDEDHSYIVKSLAGGQRYGLRFHRWLGLDKDFSSLPSAYKLSESEIASTELNDSPVSIVNEVEEDSDSDVPWAPLQRACRSKLGEHAYNARAYFDQAALDAADTQTSDEDILEVAGSVPSSKKKPASRNCTASKAASAGIAKTKKSTVNSPQPVTASRPRDSKGRYGPRDPRVNVLQAASPLPDLSPLTRPGITGATEQPKKSTALKREHKPTISNDLQRSPSLEVTRTHQVPKVDQWKQVDTTLHITLSTNDYGAVPVSLSDCMSMNTFIATALSAWGLQDNAAGVAAVRVSFEWLANGLTMVVTKAVENSFYKMLETIDEAPCWENHFGVKAKCNVLVKIIMR
ncbi:MAG: hypothetical protein M1835_001494 [Candelina submexicana]|nr:MAG: hypothetical protein M1835_001494 [Candelina submexicana]